MSENDIPKSAIEVTLGGLGFSKVYSVQGRASVADLFRKNRCGIYVLHFANGAFYVGQAVDVVRRYAQHRHTHKDIHYISFKRVGKRNLNIEEKAVVLYLERAGFQLRNIQIVSFSYGETDFDLIMSREEQQHWLEDLSYRGLDNERVVDDRLRSLYNSKYQKFQQMPSASEVTDVLREYVQGSIPAIKRSEISFWMCSCILKNINGAFYHCRLNVGFQTTLEIFSQENSLYFRWFITRTLAKESLNHFGQPLRRLVSETFNRSTPYYTDYAGLIQGGQDQVFIDVKDTENALKFLQKNPKVILAFRRFNLGLMQKSPCPWGRFHCLDLADQLVQ